VSQDAKNALMLRACAFEWLVLLCVLRFLSCLYASPQYHHISHAPCDSLDAAGKPAIGGPWSLVDLDGNLVTNTNFEGKWLLLYFGFARCPDICPSEMMKVGRVMDALKKEYPHIASQVVPVFVSIDPARDSLQALREYAKDFHPDYIFLTGTPQQVKQMAKSYRVYFSKADEGVDGDYLVDHSIVIYFHDPSGDLADCFTQSMRPSDVMDKIIERFNAAAKVAVA
jgi:protein SCO1